MVDQNVGWPTVTIAKNEWKHLCEKIRRSVDGWEDAPDYDILRRYNIDIDELISDESRVLVSIFCDVGGMTGLQAMNVFEQSWYLVEAFRAIENELTKISEWSKRGR